MKDTFYFTHDYNARQDEKIKELLMRFGFEGYGIFWAIIEDLYNNTNELRTNYERIAFELRTNEMIVKSIINDFGLFVVDGDYFGSLSVEKRLNERNEKSRKARESVLSRWNKLKENTNVLRSEYDSNTIKEKKGKEIKENESIEERKLKFATSVKEFNNVYDKDLLTDFYNYWTEHNENGKKMRFEMEKVFDTKRRLATWHKRSKQFKQQSAPVTNQQPGNLRPLLNQPKP